MFLSITLFIIVPGIDIKIDKIGNIKIDIKIIICGDKELEK